MEAKQREALGKAALLGRPVRITIPAEVAFDIKKIQKVVANVAERLGCRPCFSGADCLFLFERDFVVDPASLNVHGAGPTLGG